MLKIKTILCPTDFSEPAGQALNLARLWARRHGARLVVLHVYQEKAPIVTAGKSSVFLGPVHHRERAKQRLARCTLEEAICVDRLLAEGDVPQGIVRAAAQTGCDLIIMGTNGRTGLEKLILGSVTEQVVRRAPCPVLTVRYSHQDAALVSGQAATNPARRLREKITDHQIHNGDQPQEADTKKPEAQGEVITSS